MPFLSPFSAPPLPIRDNPLDTFRVMRPSQNFSKKDLCLQWDHCILHDNQNKQSRSIETSTKTFETIEVISRFAFYSTFSTATHIFRFPLLAGIKSMMPLNLIFVVVSAVTLMMTTVSSFTTSYSSQKRIYHRFHGDGLSSTTSKSSPSSPLLKAVPGSIFEDPAGWLKHKTEVMTDNRQITLYHILLKNDSTHYKPDSYLLEATTKLEEVRSQINENGNSLEAFGEAAKEYSEDVGSGQKNGLVGTFKRGQLDIHVDDAAFNGEVGQIIGPVKSYYGLHLLWVSDRTDDGGGNLTP